MTPPRQIHSETASIGVDRKLRYSRDARDEVDSVAGGKQSSKRPPQKKQTMSTPTISIAREAATESDSRAVAPSEQANTG